MSHPDDAGLRAVARVRAVREEDSRAGLQQAQQELRGAEQRLDGLVRALDVPVPARTSASTFAAAREALTALGTRIGSARADVRTSRTVAEAATAQWRSDRARVRMVELLLERRAAERRAAAERAEARELDDLAARRVHARRHAEEQRTAGPGGRR
jgi:flagellar export protein FliJ